MSSVGVIAAPPAVVPLAQRPAQLQLLPPVACEMLAAAGAMTITSAVFNPFDVVKTKLQTQNQLSRDSSHRIYSGALHCVRRVCVEDGLVRGLWLPGLVPSVMRDIANGGIRMGLYPAAVRALHERSGSSQPPGFGTRVLAGLLTGFSGALLANPTDVVKVRMQAEAGTVQGGVYVTGLKRGEAPSPSTFKCFASLAREEGIRKGLMRGAGASCGRAALVTSGQMASYDQTKRWLAQSAWGPFQSEGARIALASFVSGVTAATVAAPVDLVKSRVMDDSSRDPSRPAKYSGALDCVLRTVRAEGPLALWKGWAPSYLRLGPHFMVSLPLLELFRTQVMGLSSL